MTTSLKSSRPAVSVWHVSFSRAGLIPILIADCLIAYFYYVWRFTDGTDGLPPKYTLVLLAAVHSLQIFVFLLEVTIRTCQWVTTLFTRQDKGTIKFFLRKVCTGPLGLVAFLGLCVFIADWYTRASDPYTEGSMPTQSGIAVYKLYHHDQSVHYYTQKNPANGFVITILCKSDSSDLIEKTYVRCLYRERSVVMGRSPMRAPGSWVTGPLTEVDKRVLETLRQKGALK